MNALDWLEPMVRGGTVGWRLALLSILLAFVLSQAIAGVYIWTFRGLSYSRNLVQGMGLAAVVTSMLMLAIGDSIAAGVGIAGGLSIIRFRTTMRDPRDMVFVFAALAAGISAGLQAFPAALIGTTVFVVAAVLFFVTGYGARKEFDGLLRYVAPTTAQAEDGVPPILLKHCRRFTLVTLREAAQGELFEYAYQVSLPNPNARNALVAELKQVQGLQNVVLLLQEPTMEL